MTPTPTPTSTMYTPPDQLDGTITSIIFTVIVAVLALAAFIALVFLAARQKPTLRDSRSDPGRTKCANVDLLTDQAGRLAGNCLFVPARFRFPGSSSMTHMSRLGTLRFSQQRRADPT